MKLKERQKYIEQLFDLCLRTLIGKGTAYSGEEDANSNFKRNASTLGMTKYQVLAVYMNKHFDGINNAIKQNPSFPDERTEGMAGRILDAINYLAILYTLIKEDEHGKTQKGK
jgi:hypothetical protein